MLQGTPKKGDGDMIEGWGSGTVGLDLHSRPVYSPVNS